MIKEITVKKTKSLSWIMIALLLWILVGFILYPALKTFWISITNEDGITLSKYIEILTTDTSLTALKNTIILGILTVIVCGIIGTSLAFFVNFFKLPFKKLIDKLLLLPLALPGLIIVFAFVQLYGESGLVTKTLESVFQLKNPLYHLQGLKGILFIHAYTQYVYFYMNVSVGIKHIDQSVIEAGRSLGASKLKIFWSVILPFIKPALIGSSIITFMTGIGSFSAPSIIGGSFKVMTTQILLSKANNYMSIAAAEVVLLIIISMVYLTIVRLYENKNKFVSSVKGITIKPIKIENNIFKWLLIILSLLLVAIIILPVVTIIILSFVKPGTWMIDIYPREFSFDNYLKIFTKTRAFAPFINSINMSALTSLFCVVVALPASYIIVKTNRKIKFLIEFLVMLPWAMPASAIAINSINAFNKPSIFTFNKVLVGLYILLPIAYFVSLLPLMVRSTTLSLQNLNDTYIEASRCLGANWLQTFRRIILPIIAPGIIAGLLLVFVRSLGEYSISVYLYTASNKPISIAMVNGIFEYEIGLAMAYGSLIVLLTFVGMILIKGVSIKNEKGV
ncbi:iron ABC transporter permease [Clostridium sediminicola]|uniref:ABC transporter permease n=1 Tax=Clostridium sediminicola TaxID=3114879 RepID=UPI0031F2325C